MKKIGIMTCFMAIVAVVVLLTGCGSKDTANVTKLAIVGSTSVQPLAQQLADAYTEKNTGIKVDVQGVGSTAGVKAVYDGTADIGMSSRELSKEEKTWNLQETIIAIDGISVVVNKENQVQKLTVEQIRKIFKGEIKNWSELGGANEQIIVVSREAGSGTRTAFEELAKIAIKKDDKEVSLLVPDALIADGNGSVKANISTKKNAIGYMSMGMVDTSIKALSINDVLPNDENVKNKSYVFARPFIMLVKTPSVATNAYFEFLRSAAGEAIIAENYIVAK